MSSLHYRQSITLIPTVNVISSCKPLSESAVETKILVIKIISFGQFPTIGYKKYKSYTLLSVSQSTGKKLFHLN